MNNNFENLEKLTKELINKDEALKQSEEQFKALVDSIPDLVYKINKEGILVYIGGNIQQYGYDPEEVIGKMFINFVHEDDKQRVLNNFIIQRNNNDISRGATEFRLIVKNDGYRWVNVKSNIQLDNNNNFLYEIGVCRDVTDWKKIEQDLRRSEERYRNIVEDQTEFIRRALPDGTLSFINTAYARYFGKKKEQLIGENFFNFIPEHEHKDIKKHFELLTQDNPIGEITHEIIINNKVKYHRWTDRMIFDERGNSLVIQSVGRDVTDQIRLEHMIYKRCSLLQTMSDNMEALVWVKDIDNRYLFASKLLCDRLLGCTPEEAIGFSDEEIIKNNNIKKCLYGDLRGLTDDITKDSLLSCRFYEVFECDNIEYWFDVKKSPLLDLGGKIIGTVGVAFDITQDKEDIKKGISNRIKKGQIKEIVPKYVYQLKRV